MACKYLDSVQEILPIQEVGQPYPFVSSKNTCKLNRVEVGSKELFKCRELQSNGPCWVFNGLHPSKIDLAFESEDGKE